MASRIIAQLLVAGGTALLRAATQAWQQALVNAQRTGVAQEGIKAAASKTKLSSAEAKLILGLEPGASWEEVMKKYKHLYDANEKHGSFYLLSKVYRAKETLDIEYEAEGKKPPETPEQAEKISQ